MKRKQEIVTFKVDEPLWEAMRGIPNRSEFIRSAILSALDSVCPLCKGSGILTSDQRNHWKTFAKNHSLEECEDCHAVHLVCVRDGGEPSAMDLCMTDDQPSQDTSFDSSSDSPPNDRPSTIPSTEP